MVRMTLRSTENRVRQADHWVTVHRAPSDPFDGSVQIPLHPRVPSVDEPGTSWLRCCPYVHGAHLHPPVKVSSSMRTRLIYRVTVLNTATQLSIPHHVR